jgi:hypothetical protein
VNTKFLRLTAELNAFDYFEKAVFFIRETEKSDIAWKWVAISLHGALYGFLVSASYGTDVTAVLKGKDNNYLIGFDEALKRCENGLGGTTLILTDKERESIDTLKNILRDNFEHFQPRATSIELHGITTLALNYVRVIETLATEGWVGVRLKADQPRIRELAMEARLILTNSALHSNLSPTQSHKACQFFETT